MRRISKMTTLGMIAGGAAMLSADPDTIRPGATPPAAARQGSTIRYVDKDAAGANNGTSWPNAFTSLQTALSTAVAGDEICVAAGTYMGTFQLRTGVAIYGGYAGFAQPDPNARDQGAYETILSAQNNQRVLTASGVARSAVLDGVTICGGQAPNVEDGSGGGLFAEGGSPTLSNCIFCDNTAVWDGGGVCIFRGEPIITNCVFKDNTAGHEGGGLCVRDASLTMEGCVFTNNAATDGGGVFFDAYYHYSAS